MEEGGGPVQELQGPPGGFVNRHLATRDNPMGFSAPGAFIGEREDTFVRQTVQSISSRPKNASISPQEVSRADVAHMYVPSPSGPIPSRALLSADDAESMRVFNKNAVKAAATRRIEEKLLQRVDRHQLEVMSEEAFVSSEHPNRPPEDKLHTAIPHRQSGRDLPPAPLAFLSAAQAEVLNKRCASKLRSLRTFTQRVQQRVLPFLKTFEDAQARRGVLPQQQQTDDLDFQDVMQYIQFYMSMHDSSYDELMHRVGDNVVHLMGVAFHIDTYNRFMFCMTLRILRVERSEEPNIFTDQPATEDALPERPKGPIRKIIVSRKHVGWFVYTCECRAHYDYPDEEEEDDDSPGKTEEAAHRAFTREAADEAAAQRPPAPDYDPPEDVRRRKHAVRRTANPQSGSGVSHSQSTPNLRGHAPATRGPQGRTGNKRKK